MEDNFTPKAKQIWESIPGNIRVKILNNVWCVSCASNRGLGKVSGKIEKGMLILRGVCTRCGGEVARGVERG